MMTKIYKSSTHNDKRKIIYFIDFLMRIERGEGKQLFDINYVRGAHITHTIEIW